MTSVWHNLLTTFEAPLSPLEVESITFTSIMATQVVVHHFAYGSCNIVLLLAQEHQLKMWLSAKKAGIALIFLNILVGVALSPLPTSSAATMLLFLDTTSNDIIPTHSPWYTCVNSACVLLEFFGENILVNIHSWLVI